MRKYKLLKNIGGRLAGEIQEIHTGVRQVQWYDEDSVRYTCELSNTSIWEEIKEVVKEYEILEAQNQNEDKFTLHSDGKYYYKTWLENGTSSHIDFDYIVSGSHILKVSKIKRLSDNQEFKIRDKIVWDWKDCGDNKFLTIKEFVINTMEYDKHTIGVNLEFCCGKVNLFETIITSKTANCRLYVEPEKSVDLDKPVLSYNDVLKFIENKCYNMFDVDSKEEMQAFKELVKSKQ